MADKNFPARNAKRPGKPSRPDAATLTLLDEVRGIYQELASRPSHGNCIGRGDCCRFGLTGKTPYLTRGEAMVAAQGWKSRGRKNLELPADSSCPFLKNNRCQNYEARPFGCRSHFCDAAGGPTPRGEVRDLIQKLEDIDRKLGGHGACNLPAALQTLFP